mmetsp:Transcript_9419/g.31276  ORF Transcript_9419/g.31276 Transcript_9419/m.31276 type:complete len:255 (-) Transcript_9419:348-1112(-)
MRFPSSRPLAPYLWLQVAIGLRRLQEVPCPTATCAQLRSSLRVPLRLMSSRAPRLRCASARAFRPRSHLKGQRLEVPLKFVVADRPIPVTVDLGKGGGQHPAQSRGRRRPRAFGAGCSVGDKRRISRSRIDTEGEQRGVLSNAVHRHDGRRKLLLIDRARARDVDHTEQDGQHRIVSLSNVPDIGLKLRLEDHPVRIIVHGVKGLGDCLLALRGHVGAVLPAGRVRRVVAQAQDAAEGGGGDVPHALRAFGQLR